MSPAPDLAEAKANTFLRRYLEDLDRGTPRSLTAYLEEFAGFETVVSRAWRRLEHADGPAPPSLVDPAGAGNEDSLARLAAEAAHGLEADETTTWPEVEGYEIVAELGRGGQGTVYLAEEEQLGRRVALKVLRTRVVGRGLMDRFAAEQRTLAGLEHDAVAKLFAAGVTGRGEPYFAMELVDGLPITTFCDAYRLTVRQRIALFRRACQAVQHAHQRGVIHRDLKPANLLVGGTADDPTPKVLDFGLARVVEERAPEPGERAATDADEVVGTPGYIAPEQLRPDAQADARADVYALGAVLYELLAGRPPHDRRALRATRTVEELAALVAVPPHAPSACGDVAAATRRLLRGELDAVVLCALETDPERRYQSVADLSADLGRYERNRPVAAREPNSWRTARMFAQRNRIAVASAFVCLLSLVAGITATSWQAAVARRRAAGEEQANEFLMSLFLDSYQVRRGRNRLSGLELLDEAARRVEEGAVAPAPKLLLTLAKAYTELDVLERGRDFAERALAAGLEGYDRIEAEQHLASYLIDTQRWDEARDALTRLVALESAQRDAGLKHGLRSTLLRLAAVHLELREFDRCGELLDRAEEIAETEDDAVRIAYWRAVLRTRSEGPEAGIEVLEHALATIPAAAADETVLRELTTVRSRWAVQQPPALQRAAWKKAVEDGRRTLEVASRAYAPDDPRLAWPKINLGIVLESYRAAGGTVDLQEARELLESGLAARRRSLPEGHALVADAIRPLATVLGRLGELERAAKLCREGAAMYVDLGRTADWFLLKHDEGAFHLRGRRFEDAVAAYGELIAWMEGDGARPDAALPADDEKRGNVFASCGAALLELRRPREAAEHIGRAAAFREANGSPPWKVASLRGLEGYALAMQGRLDEARELLEDAHAVFVRDLPPGHPRTAASERHLADLAERQREAATDGGR